jgi:hypothetical protein
MHNQLHPHHLPGATKIYSEEEMDEDPEMEVKMRKAMVPAWIAIIASRCLCSSASPSLVVVSAWHVLLIWLRLGCW